MENPNLNDCIPGERDCVSALVNSIRTLYGHEEWADLTIEVGPRTFKVHKAVVCPRSEFFRAACKKGTFKEGKENLIELESSDEPADGDEPEIISLLIQFLYCTDYTVNTGLETQQEDGDAWKRLTPVPKDRTASTHAKVFAAAEKYGIPSLKSLACDRIQTYFRGYEAPVEDIVETIHVIYTSAPDSVTDLRKCLLKELFNTPKNVLEDPNIKTALSSYGTLTYDLLLYKHLEREEYHERVLKWDRNLRERSGSRNGWGSPSDGFY